MTCATHCRQHKFTARLSRKSERGRPSPRPTLPCCFQPPGWPGTPVNPPWLSLGSAECRPPCRPRFEVGLAAPEPGSQPVPGGCFPGFGQSERLWWRSGSREEGCRSPVKRRKNVNLKSSGIARLCLVPNNTLEAACLCLAALRMACFSF